MRNIRDNTSAAREDLGAADGEARWTRADVLCVVAIVALMLAFFLPAAGSRPLSSSHEAKAGLIARKMLRDGQWFVAEIHLSRINKPPMYYWIVAAFSLVAGEVNAWTIRLPNMLSCVAVVLLTWALARNLWDRWTGLVSAAILVTLMSFHWLAQSAKLDSMLTLSVTAAVFCFWKALETRGGPWNRRSWVWSLVGYFSLAFGVAVKGPIAVVLVGLVAGALVITRRLTREGRFWHDVVKLHPVSGLVMLVVLCAPVFWGMERAWGGGFLRYFFLRENLARAGVALEGVYRVRRSYSFFYYFQTIWVYAIPWSVFLPAAVFAATRRPKTTSHTPSTELTASAALLPLLYFGVPFLFLSTVSVKKWLYLMPIFPALAMLSGNLWTGLMRGRYRDSRPMKWALALAGVVLVAVAGTIATVTIWLMAPGVISAVVGPEGLIRTTDVVRLPPQLQANAGSVLKVLLPGVLATAGVLVTVVTMLRQRFKAAFAVFLVTVVVGMLVHDFVTEPVARLRYSQRPFARQVNQWLADHDEFSDSDIYVSGGEPYELLFYLNRRVTVMRWPQRDVFLARIRPVDSTEPGKRAVVLLSPRWFERVTKRVGPLPKVLTAAPHKSIKLPRVLAVVKLAEPAQP